MSGRKKTAARKGISTGQQGCLLKRGTILPPDLEELERRLEAAFVPSSDLHADDPCVWACACFLIHGSEYVNASDL